MTNNRLILDYAPLFLLARKKCQTVQLFTDIQTFDIDRGQFVIICK